MLSVLGPLRKKERMIIKPRLIPAGSVTVFLVFNLLIDQKPRMVVNKKKKKSIFLLISGSSTRISDYF